MCMAYLSDCISHEYTNVLILQSIYSDEYSNLILDLKLLKPGGVMI